MLLLTQLEPSHLGQGELQQKLAFHSGFSGFLPNQVILRILPYFNQVQEKALSTPLDRMQGLLVGTQEEAPGGVELKFSLSPRNGLSHTRLVALWASQQLGSETAFLKPMENTTLGR